MTHRAKWLQSKDAKRLTGHSSSQSFHKFVVSHNVQTRPHPIHPRWRLYSRSDLLRATGDRDDTKITHGQLSQIPLRKFNTYPKLKGDQILIADAHCPLIDWEFFDQVLRIKDRLKIGNLILGGDTLDCAALSTFPKLFRISWQTEKEVAREFLTACTKEFDKIVCLTANHEMRYLLKLWVTYEDDLLESGRTDVWEVATANMDKELMNKIRFTIYPYCTVNNSWRITHPVKARKLSLSLGRELAAKHNMNIIVTHAHKSGWTLAANGKHNVIDCGVFADPSNFDYVNLRETADHVWTETFVVIKDNEGYPWRKGDKWPAVI